MALSVTPHQPIAEVVIVLSVTLIIAVIVIVRAIRRERIIKKRINEFEMMFREAAHYDEQLTSAKQSMNA
jgi:hypothetical protein